MEDRLQTVLLLIVAILTGVGFVHAYPGKQRPGSAFAAFSIAGLVLGIVISIFHLYQLLVGLAVGVLVVMFLLPAVLVFGLVWAGTDLRGIRRVGGLGLVLGSCALIAIVPFQSWTLRLAVMVSQPALDGLADRVRAGEELSMPVRAGLFLV